MFRIVNKIVIFSCHFRNRIKLVKMKPRLMLVSIVSTLVLICSVQYTFGAAVMSVDLGSEWMKVSRTDKNCRDCFTNELKKVFNGSIMHDFFYK